jgi:hypothetical protein
MTKIRRCLVVCAVAFIAACGDDGGDGGSDEAGSSGGGSAPEETANVEFECTCLTIDRCNGGEVDHNNFVCVPEDSDPAGAPVEAMVEACGQQTFTCDQGYDCAQCTCSATTNTCDPETFSNTD